MIEREPNDIDLIILLNLYLDKTKTHQLWYDPNF